ncbi:MAG: hypothetical protein HWN65_10730 [Candidatus Helarchaeota archaeon]|nr:hypothetical protein [Candidatus Helarchaeota archaeon]
MTLRKNFFTLLLVSCILGCNLVVLYPIHATTSTTLNNFASDYEIDGFVSVWYYNMTDQQDISVRFDSTTLRLVTGMRLTYRTQNLLNPKADCNVSYKFESGEYIYYNDVLPNTTGENWTHAFYCQGDTFLMTNSFFYIDMGCASDDPYIQVGFDKDHSGHSMYSLNGGPWTPATVEYLVEAIVENVTTLGEGVNISGVITTDDDFVDGYKVSLTSGDDCHFYVRPATTGEHFNMRFFNVSTKLTSDANALWLEEGPTEEKSKRHIPVAGDYILLVEPDVDGSDNGTYFLYWTYDPEPPTVAALPPLVTNGTVQLLWSSPPDIDIAYYNVYRGTSVDFPINSSHLVSIPGTVTQNSYNDTKVLLDGQYFYVVTATDNTGHKSAPSNLVNTTLLDTVNPNPPTNLTYQQLEGRIILNWSAPNDPDLSFYSIFRAPAPIQNVSLLNPIANTTSTSWSDSDLPPGTYYYVVVAVDINGLRSNASDAVSVIISKPPSRTLLIILICILAGIGSVMGYAFYDRRKNPNSRFYRFNFKNFKKFFSQLGSHSKVKFRALGEKIKSGLSRLRSRFRKKET